jgi:hypothetical protein
VNISGSNHHHGGSIFTHQVSTDIINHHHGGGDNQSVKLTHSKETMPRNSIKDFILPLLFSWIALPSQKS